MRLHAYDGEDSLELWINRQKEMSDYGITPPNIKTLNKLAEQVLISFYKKLKSDHTHADRWRLLNRLAKDRMKMHLLEHQYPLKELKRMFREHPSALNIALDRMSMETRGTFEQMLNDQTQEELRFCAEEYALDYVEKMVKSGNIEISFLMRFRPNSATLEEVSIEHQLDRVPDPIGKTSFMPEKEIFIGID